MDSVKLSPSVPYRPFLIKSLQDPAEAAAYLTAILEEQDPEPELLPLALNTLIEALANQNLTPAEAIIQKQFLDTLSADPEFAAHVYALATWLENLGLKLIVTAEVEA